MKIITIKMLFSYLTMVIFLMGYCRSYKILALLPFPWKSHYRIFDPLMVELASRGHDVTVVNTFPKPSTVKIPNYTEISLKGCYPDSMYTISIDDINDMTESIYFTAMELSQYVNEEGHLFENCQPIIQLAKSEERYDLLMTELFLSDTFLPFITKFRAPWIGLCANVLSLWTANRMNEIDNPSYLQHFLNMRTMDPKSPTFFQRFHNLYLYIAYNIVYSFVIEPKCQRIAEKYMSEYVDGPLSDVVKNVSLLLSYSHFVTNVPRPHSPIVKQIGGIHISEAKPLPSDVQEFIDNSEHGVIYFSMGSLLRTSTFTEHKRDAFIRAFAKLPQRVLWKWEEEFSNGSENIKVMNWMPQRDILAHPNVKLFISHGGLLGTNEAVYEGVPILGIPIFGDQRMNIMTLKTAGVADILEYKSISDEIVSEKLHALLNDPSYAENAKKMSAKFRDRPLSAMNTAIYWIEYVIRHNGARHLRSPAIELPWYQYLLLDVIAFITIVAILSALTFYYLLKLIITYVRRQFYNQFGKVKQN